MKAKTPKANETVESRAFRSVAFDRLRPNGRAQKPLRVERE